MSALIPGQSLVEPAPSDAPGGRSAPGEVDLAAEVAALAALLAEVIQLADSSALFPAGGRSSRSWR